MVRTIRSIIMCAPLEVRADMNRRLKQSSDTDTGRNPNKTGLSKKNCGSNHS